MRYTCSALAVASMLCLAPGMALAEATSHHAPHWTYSGKDGPAHWGELASEYGACAVGKNQSPIDLKPATAEHLDAREFVVSYQPSNVSAANNGHTIQATLDSASNDTVTFKGNSYRLAQFHFHTPSEHTVTGHKYPMELHMVNTDASGNITVVGVFIKQGSKNKALGELFSELPRNDKASAVTLQVDLPALFPKDQKAIVYSGSLTTPPCSEHVNWIVMEKPIEMSKAQISAFRKIFPDNHRPVQKLNARAISEE